MPDSSSEEEEFTDTQETNGNEDDDDDSDDDKPLIHMAAVSPSRRASRGAMPASYAEEDTDDDDDDIPLAALMKRKPEAPPVKKKKAPPVKKQNGKKPAKRKKAAKKLTKKTSTVSSSSNNKSYEWASAALYGTESVKGLLIQRLLCRWWYAIEWPTNLPSEPPQHYDSLDGFPGVYICTNAAADEPVGHILDLRQHKGPSPCFATFANKPATELQALLLQALTEQRKQLVQAEGAGTTTEKELDQLIKWTKKVNPAKADREAATVLKAHRLELP